MFGAASGVERAALEDKPGSTSELRDFEGEQAMNNSIPRPENSGRVTHCASDGLLTPFDLNLLTFVRRFLLHSTGSGGGLPRLTGKGVGMTIESGRF